MACETRSVERSALELFFTCLWCKRPSRSIHQSHDTLSQHTHTLSHVHTRANIDSQTVVTEIINNTYVKHTHTHTSNLYEFLFVWVGTLWEYGLLKVACGMKENMAKLGLMNNLTHTHTTVRKRDKWQCTNEGEIPGQQCTQKVRPKRQRITPQPLLTRVATHTNSSFVSNTRTATEQQTYKQTTHSTNSRQDIAGK
jgi:hypothetical protein